ncbi:MAG TPA: GDSL-type esterase/lipase family protein [Spirochaetota bacterium]|nr:GDSL-type esterase/lipase family protein [Spirochaetota bacterium]HPF05965.1 GDSL-type esterase/lipase family protein [Spirochaetota bacterium]HPJ42589.1 GDSL-type esterase/lipase family protein [Spirochaetota bacterium]HPR37377.1 GDSL-type esterase/lipase family protein [Spirochaetota bacterium]
MNLITELYSKTGKNPIIITALGDSLTYGWLVSKGYLDYLGEMLRDKYPDLKVIIKNHGVPGDTANDGLRRVNRVIEDTPDLCFIQFALNDAFTGMSPAVFKSNIEQLIRKIKSATSAEILLLTSVPVNNTNENRIAESFYDKIIECSGEFNIPVVKVHEYWKRKISGGVSHASLVQGDGVHPMEKGYKYMAEAVMEIL